MGGSEQEFFVSGGTLPPNAASYLERGADKVLVRSLTEGRFCYVLNSRQFGKSSLSVHAIGRLEQSGIRTVFLDLTRIGGKNVNPDQWYSGIAFAIGRELGCRREVLAYWTEHSEIAPIQRLFDMLLDVALTRSSDDSSLVIFIDEIDTTRSLAFPADEFFAAIRECFNRRVSEPAFRRLTFCLLGVAVPSDLVRDRAITPFNIGERITLEDFTLDELSGYASHLGPKGEEIVARVHYWTSGHPFLSQSLCRSVATLDRPGCAKKVDEIVRRELFDFKARESNINLADVANIALHHSDGDPREDELRADVLTLYKRVLLGQPVTDDESNRAAVLLKLSGIVRSDGRRLSVRNRIYQHVFDRNWIEEHLPGQELRRERQSFRRGVLRTALVAGSLILGITFVAGVAVYSRLQALKAQERLNYELYVSDITSLRQFFETGETRRIEAVLRRHRNSPFRSFEWGYWLGRYHDAREEYTLDYNAPGKRVEGHLSTDGKQVCIVDKLLSTATILDRFSGRVERTVKVSDPRFVVPSQAGWMEVKRFGKDRFRVVDLLSERHFDLGEPNNGVYWVMPVEHSDFVATGEGPQPEGASLVINLWNVRTGKRVFSMPNPWSESRESPWKSSDLLNFSTDGRYVVYSRGPLGPLPGGPAGGTVGEARVLELSTGQIVDRFLVDSLTDSSARGFSGNNLLFVSHSRAFIRNIKAHRNIDIAPETPGSWRVVGGVISGTDLIALLDGGHLLIRDLEGRRPDTIRGNVFSVTAGAAPLEYLASANTVRIYAGDSAGTAEVVGQARRVTRFSRGTLNLFGPNGNGIRRVDDAKFQPIGSLPKLGDGSAYTYSGRWFLTRDRKSGHAFLHTAEENEPAIGLPTVPINWSCGRTSDSIAIWHAPGELMAYSGKNRRVRWTRSDIKGLSSLWVSPDGSRLFYGSSERTISVLDMANGRTLGVLDSHNLGPIFLTFSADDQKVFTCGGDGRAVMWDAKNLTKVAEFWGNDQEGMTSADLSPDGRRLVTTSRSGSWQLWDTSNGVQLMDVRASSAPLSSAVFSSDGKQIVTAGDDYQVRVWRTVSSDPTRYVPIDPTYLKDLHR